MSGPKKLLEGVSETPRFKTKIRNNIKVDVYIKEIKPYIDAAINGRHAFLASSARSNVEIKETMSTKMEWDAMPTDMEWDGEEAFITALQTAIGEKVDAFITALEADIVSTNQHIRVLYQVRTERLSWPEQSLELYGLERSLVDTQGSIVILREQRNQLIGEWIDDLIRLRRRNLSDWCHIEELVNVQKRPARAKLRLFHGCEEPTEKRFRENIFKAYGLQHNGNWAGERLVHCCISGEWTPENEMTIVRFVPPELGEENAAHIFGQLGKRKKHLLSCRIALPISRMYANAINGGHFVLVPVHNSNSNDIRIVSLDARTNALFAHLDGKLLTFRNSFRPAKKYLYFAIAIAAMHQYRDGLNTGEGWWRWDAELEPIWTFPEHCPRKSTLWAMAVRFAHMSKKDIALFLSSDGSESKPDGRDKLIADYVAVWMERQDIIHRNTINGRDGYCVLCGQVQEWW